MKFNKYFKKTKEGNGQVVLIQKIDEDPYCHQEVYRFLCPSPQSFDQQDHEMNHALPTSYASN